MDHTTFAQLLRKWREKNQYSQRDAAEVRAGMVEAFREHGLETDSWMSAIDREGARLVEA